MMARGSCSRHVLNRELIVLVRILDERADRLAVVQIHSYRSREDTPWENWALFPCSISTRS